MRHFMVSITACLVAAPVLLQTERKSAPPQTAPRESPSLKDDQIDCLRSRVYVHVGKGGLGHEHAVSGNVQSGTLHLGAGEHAGTIVFEMLSFAADLDEARRTIGLAGQIPSSTRKSVTTTMQSSAVLDVQHFPTATFEIESATVSADDSGAPHQSYVFEGKFKLHGVERPLRIQAQAERVKDRVRLRGNFTIRQSDFGIEPYSAALGTIRVADELKIYGDIWIASESKPAPH